MTQAEDPYSRAEYRRLIAWQARIEREGPWLLRLLAAGPEASVLDLGCGTGEHVAFLAQAGARAVGVDPSPAMLEAAREHEGRGHGRFLAGDARDLGAVPGLGAPFGLALCLGNMLPHLLETADLSAFASQAFRVLHPGGSLLLQILNYERLLGQGIRHLPLNLRPADGSTELVFLRLLKDQGDGRVLFFPTTLELDPDAQSPVQVRQSRRVELRAWMRRELGPAFERAGFSLQWYGDMQAGPFDPHASPDLVLRAIRPAAGPH